MLTIIFGLAPMARIMANSWSCSFTESIMYATKQIVADAKIADGKNIMVCQVEDRKAAFFSTDKFRS